MRRDAPKPIETPPAVVRHIRGHKRVPKKNRPEDDQTIILRRLANSYADKAYDLAQTEPNSEKHRLALHMAGIDAKLPRNNLRIFTTPEDVLAGVWSLWRRLRIANLEWELCDEHRFEAASRGDRITESSWDKKQDEADTRRWQIYERLVRVPARTLEEVRAYKLDRRLPRGMGNLEWMRSQKPDIAAVIDDEIARLTAEKAARKAARSAKRKGE